MKPEKCLRNKISFNEKYASLSFFKFENASRDIVDLSFNDTVTTCISCLNYSSIFKSQQ